MTLKRHRWIRLKESELSFRSKMPLKCSRLISCRFCAAEWLIIGVCACLTEVSAECRFILKYMFEEKLGTQSGVYLMEGVRLKVSVYKIKQLFLKINLPNFQPWGTNLWFPACLQPEMHPTDPKEKPDRSWSIPKERLWQGNKKSITTNSKIHKEKISHRTVQTKIKLNFLKNDYHYTAL